jgi:hypothetical protein
VALAATRVDRFRTADHFTKQIVERREDLPTLGVVGTVHLFEFGGMTTGTVFRRDDDRDQSFLVLVGIDIAFFRLVAVIAVDTSLAVGTVIPFPIQAGALTGMAFDTFLADFITPILPNLSGWAGSMGC